MGAMTNANTSTVFHVLGRGHAYKSICKTLSRVQHLSRTTMSEKGATYPVDLKILEEQPAAPVQPQPRRSVFRRKLWPVGLVAAYCLARVGIAAWNSPDENWTYNIYEPSLQALNSAKTEKLFL